MNRNASFLTMVALAAGTLLGAVSGCELLAGVDRNLIEGSGGSGAALTGGGGNSTSSPGGGGTTSSPPECVDAAKDCPAPSGECKQAICDTAGKCAEQAIADGMAASTQTAGDCKKNVCNGGAVSSENDDNDAFDDMNECSTDSCAAGVPATDPTDPGTPCTVNGSVCDGASKCVECIGNGDCKDPLEPTCSNSECIPATCDDNVKNGDETDKDCGGSCNACADNLACKAKEDCASGVCLSLVCQAPTCIDGVKNGVGANTEGDIDCGGMCPTKCGPTQGCNGDTDCAGNDCTLDMNGTCIPNCADQVKNNAETDKDCGGGTCAGCGVGLACAGSDANCLAAAFCNMMDKCVADKPNGQNCQGMSQCASGSCADGVCCESACGGTCQACTMAKTGQPNGTCAGVTMGTDPDSECAGALSCTGAGACAAPQANGVTCTVTGECSSGNCIDGYCCATACGGACRSCAVAGSLGMCSLYAAGTDPENECSGATPNCNGSGICGP